MRYSPAPSGFTLMELMLCFCIVGIVCGLSLPSWRRLQDRLAVDGATSALARALFDARHRATRLAQLHSVILDTSAGLVTIRARGSANMTVHLRQSFGVSLATTRDSISYASTGLGYGAANVRYRVTRGSAAETVTVSRTGRVLR